MTTFILSKKPMTEFELVTISLRSVCIPLISVTWCLNILKNC